MSPRRTRAKNATAHPGAIVLASQGKRRTKAEKQADENRAAADRAAAEKAEQERVITIAKMVMELRANEQNTAIPASCTHFIFMLSVMTDSIIGGAGASIWYKGIKLLP